MILNICTERWVKYFPEIDLPVREHTWLIGSGGDAEINIALDGSRNSVRWGWVFLERTLILSGIQFTAHFIDFFVVETKRFVGSFVHVNLTRQTCGQRSSRAAESKRRALGNHFPEQICYMFLISKCRGDRDLGLYTTSVLAKREPQRNGKIRFFLRRNTFFPRILPLRCGSLFASTKVVHRPGSWSPLHFDIRNIWQICSGKWFPSARRLLSAALLERWPQVCCVKITFAVLSTNRFVSTTKKSMKCVVNWIPLRISVRSRNTQPHLKVGLGIFDFCAISRRLILKTRFPHPISVAVTIYGTRFVLRDSRRRALENKFSMRICYMFLISKCREDLNLGLCTTSGLAFGELQRNGKIRFLLRRNTFFFSEVATVLQFSKCKSRSCAQT